MPPDTCKQAFEQKKLPIIPALCVLDGVMSVVIRRLVREVYVNTTQRNLAMCRLSKTFWLIDEHMKQDTK